MLYEYVFWGIAIFGINFSSFYKKEDSKFAKWKEVCI